MKFKTHLAFSFLFLLLLWKYYGDVLIDQGITRWIFASVFMVASLLPDIDSRKSFFGNFLEPLPWFFRHRGIFHSLFMAALISFPIGLFGIWYGVSLFLGYMSHLMIDMLNHQGIMFLLPFSKMKIRGFLKSGGVADRIVFFASLMAILVMSFM